MIDRLGHHAEILALQGDSCRHKDRDLGARPAIHTIPATGAPDTSAGGILLRSPAARLALCRSLGGSILNRCSRVNSQPLLTLVCRPPTYGRQDDAGDGMQRRRQWVEAAMTGTRLRCDTPPTMPISTSGPLRPPIECTIAPAISARRHEDRPPDDRADAHPANV
jgi:hypothetical protein